MRSIYKREIASFFRNLTAALFLFAVTAVMGFGTWKNCVQTGYRTVQQGVSWLCAGYTVLLPLLMCDMFAGEKRRGTDRILLSSPIRVGGIVVGKYLAYVTLLFVGCLLSCVFPLLLCVTTSAPAGENIACMVELFVFGAFLMAVMTHIAAMSPNRYVALGAGIAGLALLNWLSDIAVLLPTKGVLIAVIVLAVLGAAWLFTKNILASCLAAIVVTLPVVAGNLFGTNAVREAYANALIAVSPNLTLRAFSYGMVDVGCLLYCATGIVILLLLAAWSANRKGSGLRRAAK